MFARTDRLTLRPGWPEDVETLKAAIAQPGAPDRLSLRPWPYTPGEAAVWLERGSPADGVALVIVAREDRAVGLVGGIGIASSADAHELGVWVTPAARNCGYATEAGRAMLAIARHALGVRRLRAAADPSDRAAARVLAKLGFCVAGGDVRGAMFECDLIGPELPIAA